MTTVLAVRPGNTVSRTLLWAAGLGLIAGLAIASTGLHPTVADIEYDWLSAYGGVHSNAYLPPAEIAHDIGEDVTVLLPDGTTGAANPRTPGAVFLDLPLLLAPFDSIYPAWFGLNVAMAVVLIGMSPAASTRFWIWGLAAAISMPVISTLYFGGQATLVALLVLAAWVAAQRDLNLPAGLLLGAAACLKVWPAILLIAWLLLGRRRAAVFGLATIIGLNLAGLALPGVDLASALNVLGQGAGTWIGLGANASLTALLATSGLPALAATAVAALGVGAALFWLKRHHPHTLASPWPWIVAGLLVVPLSWGSYDVVLIPLAIALATSADDRAHLAGLGALLAWVLLPGIHLIFDLQIHTGWMELAIRAILLSGALRLATISKQAPLPSRVPG